VFKRSSNVYGSTARICVDFAEAGINTNGQMIFAGHLDPTLVISRPPYSIYY